MVWTIPSLHCCVGHTAWAPEGREGRSQAGPKGRQLEVGARRAPRPLVLNKLNGDDGYDDDIDDEKMNINN